MDAWKLRQLAHKLLGNLDEVEVVFRVLGEKPGTMLDVGAHQGLSMAPFLQRGWSVYGFEPDPANRAILADRCRGAVIDPRAVSEVDGEEVQLFTSDVSAGISTLSPFHETHTPTVRVTTVRLDTFIRQHSIDRVDFLKTDIEGFDLIALRTFPWDDLHPLAVVCEFEDNKTTRLGYDTYETAKFLAEKGYAIVVSEWEPIVEYGGSHRWRRFTRYPTEIDSNSWGNLIAVDPSLLHLLEKKCESAVRRLHAHRLVDRLWHR